MKYHIFKTVWVGLCFLHPAAQGLICRVKEAQANSLSEN